MLGFRFDNIECGFFNEAAGPQGGLHELIKFINIIDAIGDIVKIMNILKQLRALRLTTDLNLLHHINISILLIGHLSISKHRW